MKPQIADKLDVELVSQTLGIESKPGSMMDYCFDKPEQIIFEGERHFTLIEKPDHTVILFIQENDLNSVKVIVNNGQRDSKVHFKPITNVLYNPMLKLIYCESVTGDSFSQCVIAADGHFSFEMQKPLDKLKDSWLQVMAENLGLREAHLE